MMALMVLGKVTRVVAWDTTCEGLWKVGDVRKEILEDGEWNRKHWDLKGF